MKRSGSLFARERFVKHTYRVKQSTVGDPLLSSQSSRGVQQMITTDSRSETLETVIPIRFS
jgi:hypothetical protein